MASSPCYPTGVCASAVPDWLCDGKLKSITQLVLCGGNLAACLQAELNVAQDITWTSLGQLTLPSTRQGVGLRFVPQ